MNNMTVLISGEYNRDDYAHVLAERARRERLLDRRRNALFCENEAAMADVRLRAQRIVQCKLHEYEQLANEQTPVAVDATENLYVGVSPLPTETLPARIMAWWLKPARR